MATRPKKESGTALALVGGGRPQGLITEEAARLTREELDTIKRMLCPDLDDTEAKVFAHYAKSQGADLLNKEAWAQVRFAKKKDSYGNDVKDAQGKQVYERRLVMGLSKHQIQKRLERHDDFRGLESACIYENDEFGGDIAAGQIKHVIKSIQKKSRGMLVAAWCRITREGKPPYVRILYLSERKQAAFNWDNMTETMLIKCIEMDTVRSAYPQDFGSVKDEVEAEFEGELIKPAAMEERKAAGPEAEKPPAAEGKIIDAEFTEDKEKPPEIDVTAEPDGSAGAWVTAGQFNAMKALIQEFQLAPAVFGTLIEGELGRKPKSLKDVTKPEYQKIVKAFDLLRKGEWQIKGGRFDKPPEFPARVPEDNSVPF